jgi:undecaprenyl-diphosphatase
VLLLAATLVDPVVDLDHAVQEAVQRSRQPGLERSMRMFTDVGRPAVVLGGLAAIAWLDRAQGLRVAADALLALAPTNLLVEGLKRATHRARPDGERKRSNASFPSSHAANAFALATVLARRWRRLAPAFFVFAATVALSRVYLDRHWLSDVLVGAGVGWLAAWVATRWFSAWAYRRSREPARGTVADPPSVRPG